MGLITLPVLIDGAAMPAKQQLPPNLSPLSTINALSIRHESFERDFRLLLTSLGLDAGPSRMPILRAAVAGAALSLALAAVVGLLALILHRVLLGRPLADSIGGNENVYALMIALAITASLAGAAVRVRVQLGRSRDRQRQAG